MHAPVGTPGWWPTCVQDCADSDLRQGGCGIGCGPCLWSSRRSMAQTRPRPTGEPRPASVRFGWLWRTEAPAARKPSERDPTRFGAWWTLHAAIPQMCRTHHPDPKEGMWIQRIHRAFASTTQMVLSCPILDDDFPISGSRKAHKSGCPCPMTIDMIWVRHHQPTTLPRFTYQTPSGTTSHQQQICFDAEPAGVSSFVRNPSSVGGCF